MQIVYVLLIANIVRVMKCVAYMLELRNSRTILVGRRVWN
jgi:hypothetical protein